MPLLGRHKSASGSSSSSQQQQQASNNKNNNAPPTRSSAQQQQQQQQQPLCDSPLFGFRRQLPLGDGAGQARGAAAATGGSSKQATVGGGADAEPALSSVPQQITRQQINYAFSIMDTNKDGMIDLRDLSQMLANLGVPIDEAILSHIMSSVSKRGDHRVSEAEFLDWISQFIQVSDSPTLGRPNQRQPAPADHHERPAPLASGRRRLQGLTGGSGGGGGSPNGSAAAAATKSRVARSSTAGSSLAAEQPNQVPRNRRGSGSGLALMRSLSASSTSSAAARSRGSCELAGEPEVTGLFATSSGGGGANSLDQQQSGSSAADLEARNDLKAAFGVFDLDGDGFITIDEVRAGLKLLGESWSPSELQHLFSRCSGGGTNSTAGSSSRHSTGAGDLSGQRISIDDFVQLLL